MMLWSQRSRILPPPLPEKPMVVRSVFAGLVEGVEDVGGVAGGGDAEEDVAGLAEGFDLAGEDLVEAEVVGAGGEDGGVGGEGDGAEGGAVVGEADDELGDEVLGVGGGASVAGDEELAAGLHGVGGELGDGDDGVGDVFVGEDGLHGVDGLRELLVDEVLHEFSAWPDVLRLGYGIGWGCRRLELVGLYHGLGVELLVPEDSRTRANRRSSTPSLAMRLRELRSG